MQSVIILGNPENTKQKLDEILLDYKISKFDIRIFNSEKAIGIPDIKNLQKNIFLKPVMSKTKAVVLEVFYGATTEAQNAFLKILEEPPINTILIILTKSLDFILPTVLSRCNLIDVSTVNTFNPEDNIKFSGILLSLINKKENPLFIAQLYGKDKETALNILENLIIISEGMLNDKPSIAGKIKKMQKTYSLIKSTNVNVRFALENLFLNF